MLIFFPHDKTAVGIFLLFEYFQLSSISLFRGQFFFFFPKQPRLRVGRSYLGEKPLTDWTYFHRCTMRGDCLGHVFLTQSSKRSQIRDASLYFLSLIKQLRLVIFQYDRSLKAWKVVGDVFSPLRIIASCFGANFCLFNVYKSKHWSVCPISLDHVSNSRPIGQQGPTMAFCGAYESFKNI